MIDLSKIDFSTVEEQMIDLDEGQRNNVRELTVPTPKAGR
jgi:hypothetical protein